MLQPAGSSRTASVGSGCTGLSRQASAQPLQGGCLSPSAPATPQQQGEPGSAPGQQEDDALPAAAIAVATPDAGASTQSSAQQLLAGSAVPLVSPVHGAAAAPAAAGQKKQQAQVAPHSSSDSGLAAGSPPCSSPARVSAPPRVQPPHSPSPDPIAEQARQCCTDSLRLCTRACLHKLSAAAAIMLWQAFCRNGGRPAAPAALGFC